MGVQSATSSAHPSTQHANGGTGYTHAAARSVGHKVRVGAPIYKFSTLERPFAQCTPKDPSARKQYSEATLLRWCTLERPFQTAVLRRTRFRRVYSQPRAPFDKLRPSPAFARDAHDQDNRCLRAPSTPPARIQTTNTTRTTTMTQMEHRLTFKMFTRRSTPHSLRTFTPALPLCDHVNPPSLSEKMPAALQDGRAS